MASADYINIQRDKSGSKLYIFCIKQVRRSLQRHFSLFLEQEYNVI